MGPNYRRHCPHAIARGVALVAAVMLAAAACASSQVVPAADTLAITVVRHALTYPAGGPPTDEQAVIFTRTVSDAHAIADVQRRIASLHVVGADERYSCPTNTPLYDSYELHFSHGGARVETAKADATECQFWHVHTTADTVYCCATGDFWSHLHAVAGAPVPETLPPGELPTATGESGSGTSLAREAGPPPRARPSVLFVASLSSALRDLRDLRG